MRAMVIGGINSCLDALKRMHITVPRNILYSFFVAKRPLQFSLFVRHDPGYQEARGEKGRGVSHLVSESMSE